MERQNSILEYSVRLGKDVLVYGSGRVVIPLVGMITLPILTRFFTPSEYGILEGIFTISSVFALASTLMLDSSAQRSYYDYPEEEVQKRKRVVSTALWALVIWNLVFFSVMIPSSGWIAGSLVKHPQSEKLLMVSLATIPLLSVLNLLKEVLRLQNQAVSYSLYTVLHTLLASASIVVLVAVFNLGLIGYFWGSLAGGIVPFVLVLLRTRRNILWAFSWKECQRMLSYGLPLIPANCAIWVLTLADRVFLLKMTSLAEVGLYAIGVKLTQIVLLFVTGFGLAWSPFIFSIYSKDKEEEKRVRGRITTLYVFGLGLLAVFVTAFSKFFILAFATAEFLDASKVIGILALGAAAIGATQVLCTGINIARKTKYLAIFTGVAAGVNIVLNSILVPLFGFVGAACTMAACYLILCILYYYESQRLYPSPYELGKILKIAVATTVFVIIMTLTQQEELLSEFLVKTLLFLCFPGVCIIWKVFNLVEIVAFQRRCREFLGSH